jgi:hypothetical protein
MSCHLVILSSCHSALPIRAPAIDIHRPQRGICVGTHQRDAEPITIAQQSCSAIQPLGHQALFEPVFMEIAVEVRLWIDRPGQIGDLPSQHNAVAHQQRVDHIPLRIYIVGGNQMTNSHPVLTR